MIVEWLLGVLAGINDWFVSLFPPFEFPPFLLTLDQQVNNFFDNFDGLGVWADWAYLSIIIGLSITTWILALTIKLVRAAASYFVPGWGAG